MNKFQRRLIDEWSQYGKIIIAVDFDDTISPFKFNEFEDNQFYARVWNLLNECYQTGAYIVCHTSCNPDRYDFIINEFKRNGIPEVYINQTPIDLPYGNTGSKIYANIYLDDRAGLNEALEMLETALYYQRGNLQSIRSSYPGSMGF